MTDTANTEGTASQPFPADDSQPDVREDIPRESLLASREDQLPESQGRALSESELGDDGQGDLTDEDVPGAARVDEGPTDLRVQDE